MDRDNVFSYKLINALAKENAAITIEHDIQGTPTIISPAGTRLTYNPGRERLKEWIVEEIRRYSELWD
jgi:hypothetical protein